MQVRIAMTALGVAAAALAFVGPLSAQEKTQTKQMPAASECTVALTPAALKVQADPFQVKAVLSQAIGSVGAATIEESSGVQIAIAAAGDAAQPQAAAPAPAPKGKSAGKQPAASGPTAQSAPAAASSDAAQAVQLMLNTASAKPGDWTVSLNGDKGTCTGKLHVDAGGPSQ